MQVYLLNRRFQQHQEIIWRGRSAVQDRTIYEDSIFAKMLAKTGPDGRARLPHVRRAVPQHEQLHVQAERDRLSSTCRPRRQRRADPRAQPRRRVEDRARRTCEALYDGYEEFIASISKVIPVIRIDYERFATAEEMAEVIKREYLDASFLRQVTRFDPAR